MIGRGPKEQYDAIIDFMVYSTKNFRESSQPYLAFTDQYMFLNSERVYADGKCIIREASSRFLDVCKDMEHLKTDEYALVKARPDDVLFHSGQKNWIIIRLYITYYTTWPLLGFTPIKDGLSSCFTLFRNEQKENEYRISNEIFVD